MRAITRRTAWAIVAIAAVLLCMPTIAWAADSGSGTQLTTGKIAYQDQGLQAAKSSKKAAATQTIDMKVNLKKGHTIADGIYLMASGKNTQLQVGVKDATEKGRLMLQRQFKTKGQMWRFKYISSSDSYSITNAKTGKALATNGKTVYQAAPVTPGSDGYKKQRWNVTMTSRGYVITSLYNKNLAITAAAKSKPVGLAADSGKDSQRFWLFDAVGWNAKNALKNGTYTIRAASSKDLLLEVRDAVRIQKQTMQLGKQRDKDLVQIYDVTAVSDNMYKIVNVGSGMALTGWGKRAVEMVYNPKAVMQLWKGKTNADGSVTLVNAKTGWALDFGSKKPKAGKAARLTKYKKNKIKNSQKWVFSPTTTGLNYVETKGLQKANQHPNSKFKDYTNYTLSLDLTYHYLMVFKRDTKNGVWKLIKEWRISNGMNKATIEMKGRKSKFRVDNEWAHGYMCYYWSRMGGRQYMHSFVDYGSYVDDALGRSNSNGCVRMTKEHAKYIYYEIPEETRVQRYY